MADISLLKTIKETECSCERCKSMCTRPCWGTPEEIQKIIDAGFGERLCVDYWNNDGGKQTLMLQPALKGSEAKKAPVYPVSKQGCTFWKNGLCELHDLKLKPIGGRLAIHYDPLAQYCPALSINKEIKTLWETPDAQAKIAKWSEGKELHDECSDTETMEATFRMLLKELKP